MKHNKFFFECVDRMEEYLFIDEVTNMHFDQMTYIFETNFVQYLKISNNKLLSI